MSHDHRKDWPAELDAREPNRFKTVMEAELEYQFQMRQLFEGLQGGSDAAASDARQDFGVDPCRDQP